MASEEFQPAAAAQAKALGFEPALVWVPHPIQNRTVEELAAIADAAISPILARIVATLLAIVVGTAHGRVRSLVNERGETLKEAGPAAPAQIVGLGDVPNAGDEMIVVKNEREAKALASHRIEESTQNGGAHRLELLPEYRLRLAPLLGDGIQVEDDGPVDEILAGGNIVDPVEDHWALGVDEDLIGVRVKLTCAESTAC